MNQTSDETNEVPARAGERLLAVVAREHRRADEVTASFAEVGDTVRTEWFASAEELLARPLPGGYEAVILYAAGDDQNVTETEDRLRVALGGTAFFRVAA